MATYTIPRVEIDEVFTSATTLAPFPQAALIMGPQYKLWRYNEASEKAYTSVVNPATASLGNQYQPTEPITYAWPSQPNNSVVDADYAKVYFENVKAKYFPNTDLGSGAPGDFDNFAATLTVVGGSVYHSNRLKSTGGLQLKTCSTTARSDCFSGRDVAPGDIIEITGKKPITGDTAMMQATITNILYTPSDVAYGLNTSAAGSPAFTDFSAKIATSIGFGTAHTGTINFATAGTGITNVAAERFEVVLASNGADVYSTVGAGAVRTNFTFNITDDTLEFGAAHSLVENDLVYFDADGNTLPTGLTEWTAYWVHSVTALTVTLKKSHTPASVTIGLGGSPAGAVRLYKGTLRFRGEVGISSAAISSLTAEYVDSDFNIPSSAYFLSTPPASTNSDLGAILFTDGVGGTIPTVTYATNWPVLDTTRNSLDDYSGEQNVVYTLTVQRGGPFYNGTNAGICARLSVTSTTGDSSTAINVAVNTLFHVGVGGLKAKFASGTGLKAGDKWQLSLRAGSSQIFNIIETDTTLWSTSDTAFLNPVEAVTVALYLKRDYVEIPQLQADNESYNWIIDADTSLGITINASAPALPIFIYDPLLLKPSSTTNAQLPITANPSAATVLQDSSTPAANVYVQYRALLKTNTASISSVSTVSEIEPLLGVIDPMNPLAQGVYHALINAADSSPVYFIGVDSDDVAGYTAALNYATKTNLVYSLVPLTYDSLVGAAIVAHVNSLSTPAKARWRIGWLAPLLVESAVLVDHFVSSDITYDYTGKITNNPVTGLCELLTVVAGASQLPLRNIRIGDTVRYNFHTNTRGTLLWDEVTVTNTLTNTTCLVTVLTSPVTTPTSIEVVRNYTAQEQTDEFVSRIASTQDRRIRYIFPAQFKYGGELIPSYFLAAACAGLRSGVAPHQPLTNRAIAGIDQADGVSATYELFTEEQLNTLAAAGCWIVAQNYTNDAPYVRHQLTSAYALMDTNKSEDSVTTNVDSIAYGLQRRLAPYIGKYNINPTNIALISAEINAELTARATNTFTQSAGNQLISFNINSVIQDPMAKDRIKAEILLEVPTPMNNVYVKLII